MRLLGTGLPEDAWFAPVRVATTGNITLAGSQTIDGVAVGQFDPGDPRTQRVLVKDQTNSAANGIYLATTGVWARAIDAADNTQWARGVQVFVTSGSVNALTVWFVTTTATTIVVGTTAITFDVIANNAAAIATIRAAGYQNLALNGAMTFDQRNEGASSGTLASPQDFMGADAWHVQLHSTGGATIACQVVADAPPGFVNSLKLTVVSGAAPQAGDYLQFYQALYGPDMLQMAWGTSSALPWSISFWVKSSVTGTFSFALANSGITPERNYVANFTISQANTWTFVSAANIPGDTVSSGTHNGWNTDRGKIWGFLGIAWSAGSAWLTNTLGWQDGDPVMFNTGSQNAIMSTSAATVQLTGVCLTQSAVVGNFLVNPNEQERLERFCEKSYDLGVAPGTATLVGALGSVAAAPTDGLPVYFKTRKAATPINTYYSTVTGASGKLRNTSTSADVASAEVNNGTTFTYAYAPSGVSTGNGLNAHYLSTAEPILTA